MAKLPKSCWPQILVNLLGIPWGGCCGQSSGLTPGTGYSIQRAARGVRGLARGAPATDPCKGQHDPTWTLILFELALLKA